MLEAMEWNDVFFMSPDRKVLTSEYLQIPGLQVFGRHTITNAVDPLLWHYHKDTFEIVYVSKGSITFSTEQKDYSISGGSAFVVHPNEIHSTNCIPMSVGEIYWIQLNIANEENLLYLNREASAHLIHRIRSLPHHTVAINNSDVLSSLKQAFKICLHSGNKYIAAAHLTLFLQYLPEYSDTTQFTLTPDIGKSVNYILDHVTENLTLDELAEFCHLSTSQYKQKFKNQMGISPRSFINRQKIELSKILLLERNDITQVALDLGFSSSSYFSTVFKQYNTYSPREYVKRQSHGRE